MFRKCILGAISYAFRVLYYSKLLIIDGSTFSNLPDMIEGVLVVFNKPTTAAAAR